ncbi:MAG: hypothetical protein LBD10_08990 [Desulfobulbus sp.]|jgi:hypothetical protein|uniref:hypothetical protein n=1 Tax=Desulfobulbus sp. TaxID=895 RepID=UPI0028404E01|nr:hypothetical protein [Desulfobulbus sp.]MDR2550317.1 hypothetical protein [Desulfobulbus sp.]
MSHLDLGLAGFPVITTLKNNGFSVAAEEYGGIITRDDLVALREGVGMSLET